MENSKVISDLIKTNSQRLISTWKDVKFESNAKTIKFLELDCYDKLYYMNVILWENQIDFIIYCENLDIIIKSILVSQFDFSRHGEYKRVSFYDDETSNIELQILPGGFILTVDYSNYMNGEIHTVIEHDNKTQYSHWS